MPGCVDDDPNVLYIGARDGHCEAVCVQDETKHRVDWPRDHFNLFVLSQRAFLDGRSRLPHDNEYGLDQGSESHLHEHPADC